ncbi:uncharacterized protein LOC113066406 [Carassius auratus]|uniref:Uncharacterized protein LOC113066406 n=1 Tax=Carassius auratus TaxID=7957 RepID=A0A6P6MC39_CARAU|nr:uncharacterized protein LOC113066406 [Carassius auratus]
MASRKKAPKGKRPGLRSQVKWVVKGEETGDSLTSEGEEASWVDPPESSSKPGLAPTGGPSTVPSGGLASLMRDFLEAQQVREGRYVRELQGIRESIQQTVRSTVATPSDMGSIHMNLPMPGPSGISTSPTRSLTQHRGPIHRSETPVPVLQPGDDIESYLRRFERLARTWQWPREEWSCRLVPLLTGQALEAYLAMDENLADGYDHLKDALLQKFNISAETYRQRFRAVNIPEGESPTETYHRLRNLFQRWVRPDLHSKEEIGELIILEQLLRVLPYDSRTWVKEHEPESGLAAAKLAQQYQNAHRSGPRTQPVKGKARFAHTDSSQDAIHELKLATTPKLICFACQQPGHKASVCPARKAKLTGFCYVPRENDGEVDSVGLGQGNNMLLDITVNGHALKAMLDTGSALSLIKSCHVVNVDYDTTTKVQCVHGDVKPYPKAEVLVGVQGQMYLLRVAVIDTLPADMILGRDLPILSELVNERGNQVNEVGNTMPMCSFPIVMDDAGMESTLIIKKEMVQQMFERIKRMKKPGAG